MTHAIVAQAAPTPEMSFLTPTVAGTLGSGLVAVIVIYFVFKFLGSKDAGDKQRDADMRDFMTRQTDKFQAQIDRLADRHERSQQLFQEQIQKITEGQTKVIQEVTLSVKSLEHTVMNLQEVVKERGWSGPPAPQPQQPR